MKTMNDIYLLISGKQYNNSSNNYIIYIPRSFYSNPEKVKIIEQVTYKESDKNLKIERFFLNLDNVYPINLAGPAVSKVIPWNLTEAKKNCTLSQEEFDSENFGTGYYIDLRQLKMSRQNMIKIKPELYSNITGKDNHIPNDKLKLVESGFFPVPDDQLDTLIDTPLANLYIAFFENPDQYHNNIYCYNYKVCYISLSTIENNINNDDEDSISVWEMSEEIPDVDSQITYLQTYYGNTGIQAGAINPFDIQSPKDFNTTSPTLDETPPFPHQVKEGGPGGGGGATCYVANLATFKKS